MNNFKKEYFRKIQIKYFLSKNIYAELQYVVKHKETNKEYESTACIQTVKYIEDWCLEHGYSLQEIYLLNMVDSLNMLLYWNTDFTQLYKAISVDIQG